MSLSLRPVLTAALLASIAGHAAAQCGPTRFVASDPAGEAYFGASLAINGSYLLSGATYRDTAAGAAAGVVYVYGPVNGQWGQVARLVAPDGAANAHFGGSLGLGGDGQWGVVGAWGANNGNGEGYIIHRDLNTQTWGLSAVFTPNFGADTRFGQVSAMNKDGNIAAISAPYADVTDLFGTSSMAGRVLVCSRNASDTWSYQFDLHQYDASIRHDDDMYGLGVAADGTTIAVGAPGGDSAAHTNCGYLQIWNRDAFNSWTTSGEVYAPDQEDGAMFGSSVAMSGDTIAVGAPYATSGGVQEAGKVYLYRRVNGSWVYDGQITPPNPVFLLAFGSAVAVGDDIVVVGSNIGTSCAYEFKRVAPGQWEQSSFYGIPGGGADLYYGSPIAAQYHRVLIGDGSYAAPGANDAGCAYLYDSQPLACDSCQGATPIGTGTYGACTTNASVDGSSSCGEVVVPAGNDIWFSYTPYASGSVTLSTQGSDIDTIMSVHSGCPGTPANTIACNDDVTPGQYWSKITLNVAAGTTYKIRIAGYAGTSGQVVLDVGSLTTCYANCDGSTAAPILNVNDFICFQSKFAANDPWANCDHSTQPPILNVNDFICFQSKFAAGCP